MIPAWPEEPLKCKGADKTNVGVILQTPQSTLGSICLPTRYFCFQSQSFFPVTGTELRSLYRNLRFIPTLFIQFCVMFVIQAENAFTIKQLECSLKSLKSSQTMGWKGFIIAPSQRNTAIFLLLFLQLRKILPPLHFLLCGFSDFMRHFMR